MTYERIPMSTLLYGGRYASAEDKAAKRAVVSRFMKDAREGDVYTTPSGWGFEIVPYRRSGNGLGLRYGGRTVAMTRDNVVSCIKNGAALESRRSA